MKKKVIIIIVIVLLWVIGIFFFLQPKNTTPAPESSVVNLDTIKGDITNTKTNITPPSNGVKDLKQTSEFNN